MALGLKVLRSMNNIICITCLYYRCDVINSFVSLMELEESINFHLPQLTHTIHMHTIYPTHAHLCTLALNGCATTVGWLFIMTTCRTLTYMKTTTNQFCTNTPYNLQGKNLSWEAEWGLAKIIIM